MHFVLSDCSLRMAFLNFVNVSRLRSDWSSRFQGLTAGEIKDSVVISSLQKGIIKFESIPVHDFRFRWCNFRWRHIRWCNFRWRSTSRSASNDNWAVPIYYSLCSEFRVICVCTVVSKAYCVVFLFCFSSSCVPYDANFFGLSSFDCLFGII